MTATVATAVATAALCEFLGEAPDSGLAAEVHAVPGGYVYTYANSFMGHGYYGQSADAPFATVEAALAAALATSDAAAGAEFEGDLGE